MAVRAVQGGSFLPTSGVSQRVPLSRVGSIGTVRRPVVRGLLAAVRLGFAGLIAITLVMAAYVVTGRAGIPLHILSAARTAAGFPDPSGGPPTFRSVRTPTVLQSGGLALPIDTVATNARDQADTIAEGIAAQREAAQQAAAAARAAQRAAAAKAAAQRAAAQRAAEKAAAQRAAAQRAAAQKAAQQEAARAA